MHWWDIYVQVPEGDAEAVSMYLQHLGSAGTVMHECSVLTSSAESGILAGPQGVGWTVVYGALSVDDTFLTRVCALQQFLDTGVETAAMPRWKLSCRPLETLDYLTQWQRFFHPIVIGERLFIRPPWETLPAPSHMRILTLDPGLAFGTGLHPSTHMCLVLLAHYLTAPQPGTILDIGSGSGILSLAALQLGLQTAIGIDSDALTIPVAARNAMLNGLQQRTQFRQGFLAAVTGQFQVITANIYLGPLVEMMAQIVQRLAPQGVVILAGILDHQEAALQAAMRAAGLVVLQRLAEEEWIALAGQHVAPA